MRNAARLGLPVAVHAENAEMVRQLARRALAAGHTAMADFLASRPVAAEIEAITSALSLASEAGCALHIAHVSCGSAAALVAEARAAGADVTCETCPHYLTLTDEDAERIGLPAKCAPPLRNEDERAGLWRAVRLGTIDMIASDHSPAPPALKQGHASPPGAASPAVRRPRACCSPRASRRRSSRASARPAPPCAWACPAAASSPAPPPT